MSDSRPSLPSSRNKPVKVDIQRLQAQHEAMQARMSELRDSLVEKDMLIKSQRNTIRQYETKITRLESNTVTLRHIVGVLSQYIQEELNENLPPLPPIQENDEDFRVTAQPRTNVPPKKPKKLKKIDPTDRSSALDSFQNAQRQQVTNAPRSILFDENLSQNMFKNFSGAEFLKAVLDSQLERDEMQKITKFLLGKGSKTAFLFKTRTILFETLSFFLSLRNVAFQNSVDQFLPRVLEMLVDILEIERVVLYLYDENEEYFYSKAVTAELPQQVILNKDFGHIAHAYERPLVVNNPYEDSRFDTRYDQMTNFISRNIACVPLKMGPKLLGVLECSNKRGEFTTEDHHLMSQVAWQLSVGLAGELLKEKMTELTEKSGGQRGTIDSAKEALATPILNTLAEAIQTQANCERVTIYMHDQSTNELVSILAMGIQGVIRIPTRSGLASLCFTSGKTVNVENAQLHGLFNPEVDSKTGFQTKQVLAVPIGTRGVLQCLNKKNMIPFSKTDEGRVTAMAEVLTTVLETLDNFEGLLKSADFNELCLQAVKEAILHISPAGKLQKVNRCGAELFKLSAEKLTGTSLSELFERSPELLAKLLECIKEEKTASFPQEQLVLAKGPTKTVDVSCVFVAGADSSYILLINPC